MNGDGGRRVVCLYREGEDYSRSVTDWLEDFRRQTGREIETMNPDMNPNFCQTYDIVEYPTVMALRDDGGILAYWSGRNLPLVNEVLYYMI